MRFTVAFVAFQLDRGDEGGQAADGRPLQVLPTLWLFDSGYFTYTSYTSRYACTLTYTCHHVLCTDMFPLFCQILLPENHRVMLFYVLGTLRN